MPAAKNILILGGTALARQLANTLVAQGHQVTTALAGRTANPTLPQGHVEIGPLGGITGLAEKLKGMNIDLLIDATHPFASQISQNAFEAAQSTGTMLARLQTKPWPNDPNWINCRSYKDAAEILPVNARVLLTIGRQNLHHFHTRTDCAFIARMIETPDLALPKNFTAHFARPPFSIDEEYHLMGTHNITHLVTKNAGGKTTRTKLDAANSLDIKIVMIARPDLPPCDTFHTIDDLTSTLTL